MKGAQDLPDGSVQNLAMPQKMNMCIGKRLIHRIFHIFFGVPHVRPSCNTSDLAGSASGE